jgi:hypothetical protein
MHPAVLLLLRISSLLHLLCSVASLHSNGTGGNASCAPARCGDLSITYPFSLGGVQPLDCGYPAFDLTCDAAAGRAYLSRTFRERLYHVKEIFYGNNSLVVAVETTFAEDETCRIPDFNVSAGLALFPVNISTTNKNLTFVYNCEVPPRVKLPRTCGNHSIGAYYSEDADGPVPKNCSSVRVPVRGFQSTKELARDYGRLISGGFLLEWVALEGCDACTRLGGECRFLELSVQCFCGDGRPCHTSSSRGKQRVLPLLLAATFETQILSYYAMIFVYL